MRPILDTIGFLKMDYRTWLTHTISYRNTLYVYTGVLHILKNNLTFSNSPPIFDI